MYRVYFKSVFFVATEDELPAVLDKLKRMDLRYRVKRM
jgi:hypothetical protein